MVQLKSGTKLSSAVSRTQVIVIRPGGGVTEISCGGVPMVSGTVDPTSEGAAAGTTELGKRYIDEESGLEILCTRGGDGEVTVDRRPLTIKGAKPLPSSD